MKLSKLKYRFGSALRKKSCGGQAVQRGNQHSNFVKNAMKAGGIGEVGGGGAPHRLDRPGRRQGGRVGKAAGGAAMHPVMMIVIGHHPGGELPPDQAPPTGMPGKTPFMPPTENEQEMPPEIPTPKPAARALAPTKSPEAHSTPPPDKKQGTVFEKKDGPNPQAAGKKDGGFMSGIHKGALHKELGIPEGEKIPAKRLASAEHSDNPTVARRAKLAETMKKWKH